MNESLEFYKKLSDDNRSRLEEVLKRNDGLERRDEKLEEEVRQLINTYIEYPEIFKDELADSSVKIDMLINEYIKLSK